MHNVVTRAIIIRLHNFAGSISHVSLEYISQ